MKSSTRLRRPTRCSSSSRARRRISTAARSKPSGSTRSTSPGSSATRSGRPTGVINGDGGTAQVRNAAGFLKSLPKDIFESSSMAMLRDLNSAGPDGVGRWMPGTEDIYRAVAARGSPEHAVLLLPDRRRRRRPARRRRAGHRGHSEAPLLRRRRVDRSRQLGRARRQHARHDQRRQADGAAGAVGQLGPRGARAGEGRHPDLHPHDDGVDGRGAAASGRGDQRRRCRSGTCAGRSCTWKG